MRAHTQVHTLVLKVLQPLFHWAVPAKLCSYVYVDFIIWCVIKAVSEPASAAVETDWNKGPFMWLRLGCPLTA